MPQPLRKAAVPAETIQSDLKRLSEVVYRKPLWGGPFTEGITFSLLSKFLVCRERFRLKVVEGLCEPEGFRYALEYGNLWHEAEEVFSRTKRVSDALTAIHNYGKSLIPRFPGSEQDIAKWTAIAKHQFPLYVDHWKNHPLEAARRPLWEEQTFCVPYCLPSGRTILLRGKLDCVLGIRPPSPKKPLLGYVQENKAKGENTLDDEGITATVHENLQSMFYQNAIRTWQRLPDQDVPFAQPGIRPLHDLASGSRSAAAQIRTCVISGTVYNVIRRPLSDKHAIRQRKGNSRLKKPTPPETDGEFWKRAGHDEVAKQPDYYFKRWRCEIDDAAVERFNRKTFHPILEALCDWWEWIAADPFNPFRVNPDTGISGGGFHFQFPWGVYNPLTGGWRGDYFTYLSSGRTTGLQRTDNLFPELT